MPTADSTGWRIDPDLQLAVGHLAVLGAQAAGWPWRTTPDSVEWWQPLPPGTYPEPDPLSTICQPPPYRWVYWLWATRGTAAPGPGVEPWVGAGQHHQAAYALQQVDPPEGLAADGGWRILRFAGLRAAAEAATG